MKLKANISVPRAVVSDILDADGIPKQEVSLGGSNSIFRGLAQQASTLKKRGIKEKTEELREVMVNALMENTSNNQPMIVAAIRQTAVTKPDRLLNTAVALLPKNEEQNVQMLPAAILIQTSNVELREK